MPQDYYNDGPDEEVPGSTPNKQEREEDMDERDEATALLPKSVLGGQDFEPGDILELEIVATHEDEVEVRYSKEKGGKGEDEGEEQPSMSRAMETNKTMSGMDSMY